MPDEPAATSIPGADELDSTRPPARRKKRRRLWRVVRWTLGSLAVLLLLSAIAIWLVLANVNHSAIKFRVQSFLRDATALNLDYTDLSISLTSGVTAKSLRIASPTPFAEHAPEFVILTDLDLRANLLSIATGDVEVDSITVGKLEVDVITNERGENTLSLLFPSAEKPTTEPEEPPAPLSGVLANLPEIALDELVVREIELRQFELANNSIQRRVSISQLAVMGGVRSGTGGLAVASLRIGSPEGSDGVRLVVDEQKPDGQWSQREAVLRVDAKVDLTESQTFALHLNTEVVHQNVLETVSPIRSLAVVDGEIQLRPDEGKTSLRLSKLSLLADTVRANLTVDLLDTADGSLSAIASGTGSLNLPSLPVEMPGVEVAGAALSFTFSNFAVSGENMAGSAKAKGRVSHVSVNESGQKTVLRNAAVDLSASLDNQTSGSIKLAATLESASSQSLEPPTSPASATSINVGGMSLEVAADDVALAAGGTSNAPSRNSIQLTLARLDATSGASHAHAEGLTLIASGPGWLDSIRSGKPIDATIELPIQKLSARAPGSKFEAQAAKLRVDARAVQANDAAPFGVVGTVELQADFPKLLTTSKRQTVAAEALHARVTAPLSATDAKGLVRLDKLRLKERGRSPLTIMDAELDWNTDAPLSFSPDQPGAAAADVTGHIGRLTQGRGSRTSLPLLELHASKQDRSTYSANMKATTRGVAVDGNELPGEITTTADIAVSSLHGSPKVNTKIDVVGPGGPNLHVGLDANYDRASQRLHYTTELSASKLDAIAKPLRGFIEAVRPVGLKRMKVAVSGTGNLGGLLVGNDGDVPELAPAPLASLRGDQQLTVELRGIRYSKEDTLFELPAATINVNTHHSGAGAGTVDVDIAAKKVSVGSPAGLVAVHGLSEQVTVQFDKLHKPELGSVAIASTTRLSRVDQKIVEGYKLADITVAANVTLDRMRSAVIQKILIKNPAAGTEISLKGALERADAVPETDITERIPGREALSLSGLVSQEVALLADIGFARRASGKVSVPFKVESGDLVSYRVTGKLRADRVSLDIPDSNLSVSGLSGVIPIVEEIALLPDGVVLMPGPETNALARMRFFDVQPFLDEDAFVTARELRVGDEILRPVAGNIRIDRTAFAIDQLQVGYRGGTVTGQVRADYGDGDPRIGVRFNMTGVRPTRGKDRLDANMALTFAPKSLDLRGKIQIVRIGRQHLREVLDLLDPYHETTSVNRVRLALKVGLSEVRPDPDP